MDEENNLSRVSIVERQDIILNRVRQDETVALETLARELGVSVRTIYRDVQTLAAESEHMKAFSLRHSNRATTGGLPGSLRDLLPAEILALCSAASGPLLLPESRFAGDLQSGLNKILSQAEAARHADDDPPLFGLEDIVNRAMSYLLVRALHTRRLVRFAFWPPDADEPEVVVAGPLDVRKTDEGWVLVATESPSERLRGFALSRMRHVEELQETYRLPRQSNVHKVFRAAGHIPDQAPTQVVIRFDAGAAEALAHDNGRLVTRREILRDGSLLCHVSAFVPNDLIPWILSFGATAEVLEPSALREQLHAIFQIAAHRCRKRGS